MIDFKSVSVTRSVLKHSVSFWKVFTNFNGWFNSKLLLFKPEKKNLLTSILNQKH